MACLDLSRLALALVDATAAWLLHPNFILALAPPAGKREVGTRAEAGAWADVTMGQCSRASLPEVAAFAGTLQSWSALFMGFGVGRLASAGHGRMAVANK